MINSTPFVMGGTVSSSSDYLKEKSWGPVVRNVVTPGFLFVHIAGTWIVTLERTEWVEMPLTAKVHTWTVAGWSGRSSLKRLPIILVYAIIGTSKVAMANELHGMNPWDVEFEMPLKIVFKPKDQRIGAVTDFHFEPADGWKPSPMNNEKERIKKLVTPVYEWVKTLK